jgi:diguanylate cyclase (GGDEF)-like protein
MPIATSRHPPLRRQIRSLGLTLTAGVLALFMIAMFVREAVNRRTQLEASMVTEAEIIGRNSSAAVAFRNEVEASEILASLAASPDVRQAVIFLPDGTPLGAYRSPDHPEADCHLLGGGLGKRSTWWDLRWCGAAIGRPILLHDREIGTLAMEVGLESTYRALARTVAVSFALAALAFGLSIPLWRRVAARVTGPLTRLGEVTDRVSREQDFRLRAPAGGSLEVDLLAAGFNQMMSQLQQRDESLGHELDQRRHAERRLNDLAYFDPVTGLHNRHYFRERLDTAVARADRERGSCAILYIDLDGFKQVNDTLGHDRGDELLCEVARRLIDALRRSDGVCRVGGDEFAVIVDDDPPATQVEAIAAKLVEVLAVPYRVGDRGTPRVSASIGACVYPDAAEDGDSLMRHADSAMYRAKVHGKNRYCIHSADGDEARSRPQRVERALEVALARGELRLVYQPQVALHADQAADGEDDGTGAARGPQQGLSGFEALLRWHHDTLGAIGPGEFIPMAEASGAIEAIGEWALREACTMLLAWRDVNPHLKMSVNVSARQLVSDVAIDRLVAILDASELPAGAIELELTESLLVDRSETMLGRLHRLRDAGFRLAIDDFGTGYSSLAYLDNFPITTLKIDGAFTRKLGVDAQGDAIARAIVAIGVALEVDVIAEGIETPEHAASLRALGCLRGQGRLYGAPLEVADADVRVRGRVSGQGHASRQPALR